MIFRLESLISISILIFLLFFWVIAFLTAKGDIKFILDPSNPALLFKNKKYEKLQFFAHIIARARAWLKYNSITVLVLGVGTFVLALPVFALLNKSFKGFIVLSIILFVIVALSIISSRFNRKSLIALYRHPDSSRLLENLKQKGLSNHTLEVGVIHMFYGDNNSTRDIYNYVENYDTLEATTNTLILKGVMLCLEE